MLEMSMNLVDSNHVLKNLVCRWQEQIWCQKAEYLLQLAVDNFQ